MSEPNRCPECGHLMSSKETCLNCQYEAVDPVYVATCPICGLPYVDDPEVPGLAYCCGRQRDMDH